MRISHDKDQHQWPEIWQAAYRLLEETIVHNQLRAWIQPLELLGSEQNNGSLSVHFAAPNDFSANWVRDHYQRNLETAFTQVTGSQCEIFIRVSDHPSEPAPEFSSPPPEDRFGTYQSNPSSFSPHHPVPENSSIPEIGTTVSVSAPTTPSLYESALNQHYTFENFIVGASNQFAHASAVAVAEQPARQYNPLFIYSPPGLGKTHLLHAIGNHLLQKNPKARVAYLSAEAFMNDLIDSIQHNQMPAFRNRYREGFDLLLIDDIQFIAKKKSTEEEFFHTFNALHSSKRQIVLTSDRPPKEIEGLEERIRTRFEWGLVADIQAPEIETRIAILKAKAERDDIYLPDEVATFLATYIKSNMRELEGILVKLQAQASLTGAEISLEMAKTQLKHAVPEESSHFTAETILAAVAKHFQVKMADLKSNTRARTIALPRQIAMYLIRKYTGLGLREVGLYFGGKDHTTVLHACQKIEESFESDSAIREMVEGVQNIL